MRAKGFSLIELMVVVGILSILVYFGGGIFVSSVERSRISANSSTVLAVRDSILSLIRDDSAWAATVAGNNAAFGCWTATGDCTGQVGWLGFDLLESNGARFRGYNPNIATNGFGRDGQLCNTFNAAAPNPTCLFRFTFSRRFVCDGGVSCIQPKIEIRVIFDPAVLAAYDAQNRKMINVDRNQLSVTLVRAGGARTIVAPATCAPGEVVTQVSSDGTIVCTNWNSL